MDDRWAWQGGPQWKIWSWVGSIRRHWFWSQTRLCTLVRFDEIRLGFGLPSPHDIHFQILHRVAFIARFSVLGMLSSAISAFQRAYYHFPTRPEWRERAPWPSLRNLEVGAESARCVLVEFSAPFWASKSTFGAPWTLLESENMRFLKVRFLFNFCMRWNQQFSCSGSAYGQVGFIFWWVLGSFFDGCGDLQMTTGAPLGPIGTPGSKKYKILSIRLANNFSAKWKQSKSHSEVW